MQNDVLPTAMIPARHVSVHSHRSLVKGGFVCTLPVPIYALFAIEKPTASHRICPQKFSFFVHVSFVWFHCQKSCVTLLVESTPVPIYPFFPIERPTANRLLPPGKSAFFVHVFPVVSYSQKSL